MKGMHAALIALSALMLGTAGSAAATTIAVDLTGPGVSGSLLLTYGAATDAKYPDAFEITDVSGTFSDSNNGLAIVDAPILGLIPVTHDAPESTNLLAPHDFSRFAVATGLSPQSNGYLTFDNLYWPGGSPQTASDYPPHGGFLDIYGLMVDLGGGRVLDVWSNGITTGPGADYGVGLATAAEALDYVAGGVAASATTVPEPASLALFAIAALGLVLVRRRDGRA